MISRFLLATGLALLMVVAGVGTYAYLGSRQSNLAAPPQEPTQATPSPGGFSLPGTMFLTQNGAIYSLSSGRFHQLTRAAGWTQLAPYPGNNLLAVKRSLLFSDVYIVSRFGRPLRSLTHNTAAGPDTGARHWSFYPRMSRNNKTLFMSYDEPKFGFDVPMSIWAVPVGSPVKNGKLWTISIDYTGGDMQPLPLANGGLIYTKYSYVDGKLSSQIWYTRQPEQSYGGGYLTPPPGSGHGRALTRADEDCAQPSISPNGKSIAMICTHQTQVSYLVLASFNGSSIGVRHNLITNQLVAQPTWAPDSTGIAYLAPAQLGQGFQLWFLPKQAYAPATPSPVPSPNPTPSGSAGSPSPSPSPAPPVVVKPIKITSNLGFDATSPIVWIE